MRTILISRDKNLKLNKEIVEISKDFELQDNYKLLNCKTIQCLPIKINNKNYTITIDEEGKLKPYELKNITLFFIKDNKIIDYIVGNILISKTDINGYTRTLTDKDISNILNHFDNNIVSLKDNNEEYFYCKI